jgi:asparagine synthase (glutamine-hydrolysing)
VATRTPTRSITGNDLLVAQVLNTTSADFVVRLHGGCDITVVQGVVQHEFQGIRLLLIGDCLLSPAQRSAELAAAVAAGKLDRTAEWPGSYSVVILSRRDVIAYSDLAGQFPLYYSRRGDEFLIGSDLHSVAVGHYRRPDPVSAAMRIACPAVLPMWSTRSAYADVGRLAGGAVLRGDADSLSVRLDTTRLPLPVAGRTLGDGAAMLRSALTTAVRSRSENRLVSSDFSGGLDSTSLAFLATRYSSRPVASIVYHQPLAPAEDIADAVRFAGLDQRIDLAVVRGSAGTLPFTGLSEAAGGAPAFWSAEPSPGALAAGRTALRLAAASTSGAQVHLTGEGGDALLLAAPSYLAGLARQRHTRTLLQHCASYGRLRFASPGRLAARAVRLAATSSSRALTALAAELENPVCEAGQWADLISWWPPCGEAATWLTPAIRRQLAAIAADPMTARAVGPDLGPADLTSLTDLRRSGEAQRHLRELAQPYGISVQAPFLDSEVITAALSVPAAARADPRSYKPLLRVALRGLVPAAVFDRRTKGDYAAEDYLGARAGSHALRNLLRDSRLAALGVIEPGALDGTLDRMIAGVAVPLGPLNMLLATESWLRSADRAQIGS